MMKKTKEDGYLLVTTLLLLILSGLFLQATIHIYSNQIIQFKQFSSAYEYKAILNMGEIKLREFVKQENEGEPIEGTIETSLGPIKIEKMTEEITRLTISSKEGGEYSKDIQYNIENKNESVEDEIIDNDDDVNLEDEQDNNEIDLEKENLNEQEDLKEKFENLENYSN